MKESDFKPLPFWKELLMKEEELPNYYRQKREYEYENNLILNGMKWRKKLHPILLSIMKFDRKFINKQTLSIIKDERIETNAPVIYAITHIGMYDYQIVSEAIKKHQYPFAGDPETMYRSGDGFVLALNGIVYCDTESKVDRKIAKETAKEVLNRNTDLLIYPEGVWNITPNLLSLPLFPGVIDIAMETGADIVPVAVEQYSKDFYVNIGKNIKVTPNSNTKYQKTSNDYIDQKKEELRTSLATLKWEIFEKIPVQKRENLKSYEEEYENFVNTRLNEWINPKTKEPYYNEELIKHRTYKIKNVNFSEEVFSYMGNLKLNKNNAFIFRKDNSLPIKIQEELEKKIGKR